MQSNEPEIWEPVVGHEGSHAVSDHGRVRSLDRTMIRGSTPVRLRGRVLRPSGDAQGEHQRVVIGGRTRLVHSLVLEAFIGPRPPGFEACHNDGDPANNRLSNLRWDTRSANTRDRVRHGTHQMSNRTHCPHGHVYATWNLEQYTLTQGRRRCLACTRARSWSIKRGLPFDAARAHAIFAGLERKNA